MARPHQTIEIRLPEGVSFSLAIAGPVSRCLAFLIDMFIISAVTAAFQRLVEPVRVLQEDFGTGLLIVVYLATWLMYGIVCEYYWNGQTFGKWLLGIRVMDAAGLELQFHQVAIRNLIRSVDLFPAGLLGGMAMICNPRLQRLGDLAASTIVIRTKRPSASIAHAQVKSRYNSLLQYQLLCARLRQRVPAQVAGIALDAMMRRDRLEDRARVVLFDELAAYFRSLVEFPPEDIEQLSSEQYVRNVLEILYTPARRPVHAATLTATS